jgi:aconitate hydratase
MEPLPENIVLEIASSINDLVTTTDELIPSGETSSWRSNPMKLAEFTLSRKDPGYVRRAKAVQALEKERIAGASETLKKISSLTGLSLTPEGTGIGSAVYAVKPGDGSAREQAASCQRVLGGWANVAREYATKRYRSNLCNWGMLPFLSDMSFSVGQRIVVAGIRKAVEEGQEEIDALLVGKDEKVQRIKLRLPLSESERPIVLAGSLINFYAEENKKSPQ